MAKRSHRQREAGFTLVEVMVAATILIVGVLGTLAMLDTAGDRSAATRAREGGTNLARELAEAARRLPYSSVSGATIRDRLRDRPALAGTLSGGTWTIERRGRRYDVVVEACSVDDAGDGTGAHDSGFCAGGPAAGTADRTPEDHKRVTVLVAWTQDGRRHETRQTTLLSGGARADGPNVSALSMTAPATQPITSASVTSASFWARTARPASAVQWSVDGGARGLANGSDTTFTFNWTLPDADGTYDISAGGFNAGGAGGETKSITVALNRFAPRAADAFNAGLNGTAIVEAEWTPTRDRDVLGYRVYRRVNTAGAQLACPLTTELWCVDASAPTSGTLRYFVVAVDRDERGRLREGTASTELEIDRTNRPPSAPSQLSLSRSGDSTTLTWRLPNTPDPDSGDYIESFRIYRDGTAVANRYDRTDNGTTTSWTDTATGGATHTYYVRAVDTKLRESTIEGPVSG